jgi:Flp pilus assembly protein TadB
MSVAGWAKVKAVVGAFVAGLLAVLAAFGFAKARRWVQDKKADAKAGGEKIDAAEAQRRHSQAEKAKEEAREKTIADDPDHVVDGLDDAARAGIDAAKQAGRDAGREALHGGGG